MSVAMKVNRYKSPLGKLVKFFELSRNKWKDKCKTAKRGCKSLKNQVSAVEQSRGHWKTLARERQAEISALREELEQLKSVRSH